MKRAAAEVKDKVASALETLGSAGCLTTPTIKILFFSVLDVYLPPGMLVDLLVASSAMLKRFYC